MQQIAIQKSLPCLIIDGGYYTFYRYFATLRWFQFKEPNPVYDELHNNAAFVQPFMKHVKDEIESICKRWKTTKENILFARDCPRDSIWRNAHAATYKSMRVPNAKFNSGMFRNLYDYLKEQQVSVIDIHELEADDVAALTKAALRNNGYEEDIIFITNDNDYLQLLDERTHAYNLHEKDGALRKRSCGNASKDLRVKILMGDKSDNIPPVWPRLGTKTAEKLAELSDADLRAHLESKGAWEPFEKNQRMIDMNWMMAHYFPKYNECVQVHLV